MILSIFLIFLLSSTAFSVSGDCDGHFSYENSCNKLTLEFIAQWVSHRPIPSMKIASNIGDDCIRALSCTKMINCPEKDQEISKKIADIAEMCTGIYAFGSAFGKCIRIIQSKESSKDYPCLQYWDNVNQSPTCEFFGLDFDCAQMLVENQCGMYALKQMNDNKNFIADFFGCKLSSTINRMESKKIGSSEKDDDRQIGFLRESE
ncbi:Protein CBG25260 [Caenorhabditis briggsae]|uniref:T20D4.11-like domain-containing protein n=2 Tax=Caenorhabditis briggsae TaxID=6238 RepID=A0AAE9IXR6_CAEBR|nr:Protein CBG25260 [Caenorhabditis briggsae]ULU10364.1 hypothetical protein L3Y34_014570 [Caenorhabditis briggsae]CAR98710.1 Protein CBG25260 [Caenorhabditis briggsae]